MLKLLFSSAIIAGIADNVKADVYEKWDYVTVRPGAHMFYYYYQELNDNAPCVWWAQGGPSGSSIAIGALEEIGPYDKFLKPRSSNETWSSQANILFIENPVGTGYSYVDDLSLLTTNNTQIAEDLVVLFQAVTEAIPSFQTCPLWFFGESYGGKMIVTAVDALLTAVSENKLKLNIQGIAMGDSWVSPVDFVDTWGQYLVSTTLADNNQLVTQLNPASEAVDKDIFNNQWLQSTNDWSGMEDVIEAVTDNVSFYNILIHDEGDDDAYLAIKYPFTFQAEQNYRNADINALKQELNKYPYLSPQINTTKLAKLYNRHVDALHGTIFNVMNGPLKKKFNIPSNITWGMQAGAVFSALSEDFMKPVVTTVDKLLNEGKIKIVVYNGQLDLICATVGTESWLNKLTWSGMSSFFSSAKLPFYPNGGSSNTAGFIKTDPTNTLTQFFMMNGGHMYPADNPFAAYALLREVLNL